MVLFEIYQRFKSHFLSDLRVSFKWSKDTIEMIKN